MRILITGASGFVGPYCIAALRNNLDAAQIIGLSRSIDSYPENFEQPDEMVELDICDQIKVNEVIKETKPDHIIHLAGVSNVPISERDPTVAWRVNVLGTLNLAHAALNHAKNVQFIFAGSGQIYGDTAQSGKAIDEGGLVCPNNEYSATKAAADLALGSLANRGLRSVRFRAFNHTGPGQTGDFVLASFVSQIAKIEAGLQEPVLSVGNLDVERDFMDVRDVAKAYMLAVLNAERIAHGEIFNLCSGTYYRLRSLLDILLSLTTEKIEVRTSALKVRSNDIQRFVGDPSKAARALDWKPECDISDTLEEMLKTARKEHTI